MSLCLYFFQACVVAVAVPDPDVFPRWAKENLGIEADMIDLCTDMVKLL